MIYLRRLAAGLLAASAMAATAYAVPVAGSDSLIVVTVGTSPATDLLSTVAANGTLNLGTVFWAGGSGDLGGIPSGTVIGNTSITLTPAGLGSFGFSSADGSFVGSPSVVVNGNTLTPQFTGTSGSVASGTETLGLYLVGTFTPAGSIGTLDPDSMSIALTVNENGITGSSPPNLGSFSASVTVAAPATSLSTPPSVPEPLSTLLLGTGLLGLATVRWRRHRYPNRANDTAPTASTSTHHAG